MKIPYPRAEKHVKYLRTQEQVFFRANSCRKIVAQVARGVAYCITASLILILLDKFVTS